jgi:cytochrome P450
MDSFPTKAHKNYSFSKISREHQKHGAVYLDLWPFGIPFLSISSPFLAAQACQTSAIAVEKPEVLRGWTKSIAGGPNIFSEHPKEWKYLRDLFNPGFSTGHFNTYIPALVEESQIYLEKLRKHARQSDLIHMDPLTMRFFFDVIGRTAL